MKIFIRKGDITHANVDAIVNAANSRLQPQSGVCGMIFTEAGYEELKEECNKIGYVSEGNCAITKGYNLEAKYIIHAVGPIYKGSPNDDLTLALTYNNALNLALENNCLSIAFPILSTGLYNYPYELASKIAVETVLEYKKNHENDFAFVYFYCYDDEIYNIFLNTYNKVINDWKYKINDVVSYEEYLKERDYLVKVFKDTREKYNNDELLIKSIKYSLDNTIICEEEFKSEKNVIKSDGNSLIMEELSTINTTKKYRGLGKVAILNFASSTRPGGGVINGSKAQEESICRVSTLYKILNDDSGNLYEKFYGFNKQFNGLGSNKVIYSPDVTIFKDEDDFSLLDNKDWYKVDVITACAPNIGVIDIYDEGCYQIFIDRIELIINSAIENDVDIIILGAFGCGVFMNNPNIVSKAFKEVLKKYRYNFKNIIFAIPKINNETSPNFKIFSRTLFDF